MRTAEQHDHRNGDQLSKLRLPRLLDRSIEQQRMEQSVINVELECVADKLSLGFD